MQLIIVRARIRLRTHEEGGRIGRIATGYRPNHVFELPPNAELVRSYIGDIQFDEPGFLEPGETRIVAVRFLRNYIPEEYIQVGKKWFINEGGRTVGDGEIIEIL